MTKLFRNKQRFKTLAIIVGSFFLLLLFGAFHYSKGNRINTYLKARSATSGPVFENIKEYLVWEDTKEQITNDEARFTHFRRYNQKELAQKLKNWKKLDQKVLFRLCLWDVVFWFSQIIG